MWQTPLYRVGVEGDPTCLEIGARGGDIVDVQRDRV